MPSPEPSPSLEVPEDSFDLPSMKTQKEPIASNIGTPLTSLVCYDISSESEEESTPVIKLEPIDLEDVVMKERCAAESLHMNEPHTTSQQIEESSLSTAEVENIESPTTTVCSPHISTSRIENTEVPTETESEAGEKINTSTKDKEQDDVTVLIDYRQSEAITVLSDTENSSGFSSDVDPDSNSSEDESSSLSSSDEDNTPVSISNEVQNEKSPPSAESGTLNNLNEKPNQQPLKVKKKKNTEEDELDLLPIEDLQISVKEEEAKVIGTVVQIVGSQVVIEANPDLPAINLESVLFLDHGGRALGRVFDVFGPVQQPLYVVRFTSPQHILEKEVKKDDPVYFAPQTEHTSYVIIDELLTFRGSDASWKENREPPVECLDYSDDEEERRAKQALKQKKMQEKGIFITHEKGPRLKRARDDGRSSNRNPFVRRFDAHQSNISQQSDYSRSGSSSPWAPGRNMPPQNPDLRRRPPLTPRSNFEFGAPPRFGSHPWPSPPVSPLPSHCRSTLSPQPPFNDGEQTHLIRKPFHSFAKPPPHSMHASSPSHSFPSTPPPPHIPQGEYLSPRYSSVQTSMPPPLHNVPVTPPPLFTSPVPPPSQHMQSTNTFTHPIRSPQLSPVHFQNVQPPPIPIQMPQRQPAPSLHVSQGEYFSPRYSPIHTSVSPVHNAPVTPPPPSQHMQSTAIFTHPIRSPQPSPVHFQNIQPPPVSTQSFQSSPRFDNFQQPPPPIRSLQPTFMPLQNSQPPSLFSNTSSHAQNGNLPLGNIHIPPPHLQGRSLPPVSTSYSSLPAAPPLRQPIQSTPSQQTSMAPAQSFNTQTQSHPHQPNMPQNIPFFPSSSEQRVPPPLIQQPPVTPLSVVTPNFSVPPPTFPSQRFPF